ncbi:MAG: bifunctional folylpolyglutamate synthase/dihydrofolate synthase [Rhodospirillaceae bacterium]|nr:bifunctional folylpolyglutamate synthase/dihydrofolate synthase [Rhodospirillaceae bacterium]MBL6940965.1 bifunctional folylpolyglutamate synthase/dihydrofolate synthase [Rhodospirillales bacterium]
MDLHPKVIDLTLGRVETLLERLGNPETRLPPVVHVAGTNAKGSLIAYMRSMLEAAGYKVHVYTSPHLVRFNERIRLAGSLIEDDQLAALLEECESVNAGDPITYFEITTATAFLAFSKIPADVVLLETGLGGRLDATNVIEKPALTVITPVSMDHQHYLGETLLEIITEKVGIVKPGVVCLSSKQERKVEKKFCTLVEEAGAPLLIEGQDWHVRKSTDGMVFECNRDGEKTSREFPRPALAGSHQLRNAGLAIAALDRLDGFHVPDSAIALGLKSVDWPARLQRLKSGPLVDLLPGGWELWLDGGHNAAAAKTIASHARGWRDKPLHMIFGMLNSKNPSDFLTNLEGRLGQFRGVSIPGEENSLSAQEVTATALNWRMEAAPAENVTAALTDIIKQQEPARVLIAGSLYLAGTVLKENS